MTAMSDYAHSTTAARQAIADLACNAAALGCAESPAAEMLELLRVTLHRQIDDAIDEEALRHPSPRRMIARAPRYGDLIAEVRGWA